MRQLPFVGLKPETCGFWAPKNPKLSRSNPKLSVLKLVQWLAKIGMSVVPAKPLVGCVCENTGLLIQEFTLARVFQKWGALQCTPIFLPIR